MVESTAMDELAENHSIIGSNDERSRHSSVLGPYRKQAPITNFPLFNPTSRSTNQMAVYSRSLMSSGHGIPVFQPLTSQRPKAHLEQGTSIGDVGYLDGEGGFEYRFNLFYESDHPAQGKKLPRKFLPLRPELSEWDIQSKSDHFGPQSYVTSEGITASHISEDPLTIEFSSTALEGAILVLPHGASREDLMDRHKLIPYVAEHASDWYQFLNSYSDIPLEDPRANSSLFIVTGTDKCRMWNTAFFPEFRTYAQKLTTVKYVQKNESSRYWDDRNYVETSDETATSTDGHPCAMFLRGLHVSLNKKAWAHGIAPIPLRSLPLYYIPTVPPTGRRATLERVIQSYRLSREEQSPKEIIFHPSIILLQLLINHDPTVDVAVVDDYLWSSLLDGRTLTVNQFLALVHRILDRRDLTSDDGVLQFGPKRPVVLSFREKLQLYLQFLSTGSLRPKAEQNAIRKLKTILAGPIRLPPEESGDL